MSPSNRDDELVAELAALCLDRMDEGNLPLSYADICAEHPELEARVVEAVERASELPSIATAGLSGDPFIGTLIANRYRVNEQLGSGAMGVVYAATDLDLGRDVAVKLVHPTLVEHERSLARFDREAATLATLKHDAIVTIHDRGVTSEGLPFLVMERVEGVPCSDVLRAAQQRNSGDAVDWMQTEFDIAPTEPTSFLRQAIRWTVRLCEAMESSHAAGVFHRDIKPSNVLIRSDASPILIDFGIAAVDDDASMTRTGSPVGTPSYMPPEAVTGTIPSQAALDVYGLTATLYHLVTLHAPYEGTPAEVMAALVTREPKLARNRRPGIPAEVEAVLDKGLAKKPAARYASVADLREDLQALLAFEPTSVRPLTKTAKLWRRVRRKRSVMAVAATLLFVGAVLGAIRVSEWRDDVALRRYQQAESALPANLGVVQPLNRRVLDPAVRAEVQAQLAAMVESGYQRPVALIRQAAFAFDQGDLASAAELAERMANEVDSPYARALAQAYKTATPRGSGPASLDIDSLPKPSARWDYYLAGLHLIRTGRVDDSEALLAHPSLDGVQHVSELRYLLGARAVTRLLKEGEKRAAYAQSEALLQDVRAFEATRGHVTPTTLHVKSSALLRLSRWRESREMCREGLELAPASPVLLQNDAEAAIRLQQFEEACQLLQRALAMCPDYLTLHKQLTIAEVMSDRLDEARTTLRNAPFALTDRGARERAVLTAEVYVDCALYYMDQGEDAENAEAERLRREAADVALEACAQLSERHSVRRKMEPLARAVRSGDEAAVGRALAKDMPRDPLLFPKFSTAMARLPKEIDPETGELLRDWLQAIHDTLDVSAHVAPKGRSKSVR